MSRLESMRVFARVAALGSFSRAAAELGMSPSTVTLQVRTLEEALGVRLLNRTTRHTALTEEGRLYLDHCLRIAAEIAHMDEVLAGSAPVRGTLRVDVPVVFGRLFLVPRLPAFLAAHPALSVHVTMENRHQDLAGRDLDCAVRIGDLPDSSLVARRLGCVRWVTCASPAYLAQRGVPLHPDDLAGHNCLGWLEPRSRKVTPWRFGAGGDELQKLPGGNLAFDSLDPLVEAATGGLGLVQVAEFAVRELCRDGRLRMVLPEYALDGPAIHLLYPHRAHVPAKVRAFCDFLMGAFA